MVRVMVVVMLLIGQVPSFGAVLLVLSGGGGEHEVICGFCDREISVLLVHSLDPK